MFLQTFARTLLLGGALAVPLTALANPYETTLTNGMKVIVKEDRRAPSAVHMVWYRSGAMDEVDGISGVAHVLEHMMFKGTKNVGPGEFNKRVAAVGGRDNAFTGKDYTAYFQQIPPDRLSEMMALEADRMQHLVLDDDAFRRELEVVKEERRLRTDDKPSALAYERFKAMAYPASGYHNPTIGWMADLERMTVEELRAWYQVWYAPNNATLVVVGDVTKDEVRGLAEQYFGAIPRRDVPPAKLPRELAEPGERRLTLHVKTQLPSLLMGFNVPGLATSADARQVHALRLIAALLDGGYSARLPANLERGEELVSGASASYDAFQRGDSLFLLSATPNVQKGKTLEQAEAGLWRQLEALQKTPPSATELARVRAQVIAGLVYERDSITSQATTIGALETVGLSWTLMDQDLAALEAVTPADIQQAAQTFFTRSRLAVAHILPENPVEGAQP